MKINDMKIRVMKGGLLGESVDAVLAEMPGPALKAKNIIVPLCFDKEFCATDRYRLIYAHAFQVAHVLKAASLGLTIVDLKKNELSSVARAKIIAQEILRYAREDKECRIRRVDIFLPAPKYSVYKKTIEGYINHVVNVLSKGPFVTVDAIIEIKGGVVLIKRSNPPFGWALPGGFLDSGESLEEAVLREAREETGLAVKNLEQMHTYSDPRRDPRFHTIATVFVGQAKGRPSAASDAMAAKIFKPKEWKKLEFAFDHRKVLEDYLRFKNKKS